MTATFVRTDAHRALEAIVLVADEPVPPNLLAQLLERPVAEVEAMAAELAGAYEAANAGFVLARVAGGYRFQTAPDAAPYVERFVLEGQSSRLSAAAMETLAIVAYKQPVSRAQVAAIRGVNVDGVMRTLQQRGYVAEVGRDPGPGQAVLYGTTRLFLEKLGIDSLDDLPPLGAFVPAPEVMEALEAGLRIGGDEPAGQPSADTDAGADASDTDTADDPDGDGPDGDDPGGDDADGGAADGGAADGDSADRAEGGDAAAADR